MRDSISIGSAPANEDCAQVGKDDYHARAIAETRAFINQLKRVFGEEPFGAKLKVKSNQHDFGTYLDVECVFDSAYPDALKYCFEVESKTPADWDNTAKRELKEFLECE